MTPPRPRTPKPDRSAWVMMNRNLLMLMTCALLSGCGRPAGYRETTTEVTDDFRRQWTAAYAVDRNQMGFPPLPTNGAVTIVEVERDKWASEYPPPTYDVILQFYDIIPGTNFPYTSRSVGLKRTPSGYQWIHEQQMFHGPNVYRQEEDGILNERVTLTREMAQVAIQGASNPHTVVGYSGPDLRFFLKGTQQPFVHRGDLALADVLAVLHEWGYETASIEEQPNQVPEDTDRKLADPQH